MTFWLCNGDGAWRPSPASQLCGRRCEKGLGSPAGGPFLYALDFSSIDKVNCLLNPLFKKTKAAFLGFFGFFPKHCILCSLWGQNSNWEPQRKKSGSEVLLSSLDNAQQGEGGASLASGPGFLSAELSTFPRA